MFEYQVLKCPFCDGTGITIPPSGVAWVSIGTDPHECQGCAGVGMICVERVK